MDTFDCFPDGRPSTPIFHYTTQNGFLGIVGSGTLWATDIRYLNDEAELDDAIALAQKRIEIVRSSRPIQAHGILECMEDELNQFPDERSAYVCSFCEDDGDRLSQWRGYCAEGTGFSLGFDFSRLESLLRIQRLRLRRCLYDPEQHESVIQRVLEQTLSIYDQREPKEYPEGAPDWMYATDFMRHFLLEVPRLKHRKFEEEKEWRLVSLPIWTDNERLKYREGKSTIIPYVPVDLKDEKTPLSFSTIFVGPTPNQMLALNSVNKLLITKGISCPSIQLSDIPYRGRL